jgi:Flp pilus assembly protein TadG
MDFGHAWYMRQVITTASREGARYGTRYQTNAGGTRIAPNSLDPSITNWITTNYQNLLPADASLNTTISGDGATSGTTGADLSITVNATKNWFLVHHFVPGMTGQTILTATSVMKCE